LPGKKITERFQCFQLNVSLATNGSEKWAVLVSLTYAENRARRIRYSRTRIPDEYYLTRELADLLDSKENILTKAEQFSVRIF